MWHYSHNKKIMVNLGLHLIELSVAEIDGVDFLKAYLIYSNIQSTSKYLSK